ncbi:hypothetical protein A2Z22_01760 [Candidatus Woesebacteria bacterium RBG_16_34_12]|uniref:histidine kinase n=1 Tax=Candidatus Woesebacteria bacterium RBG_16_34_12 TaxID=1802480 RepID=A0A1F7XAY9_9BACT|nr:MAG: hypothetical protein A2Z22_01760 [Candidatus Woesebacteria bacterium RBG_16_34_12]
MFKNARIKLTLWYLVIIMLVSGFFSLIVYRGFTKELGRGFHFQAMHNPYERRILIQERNGFSRILPFFIYPEELPPEEVAEIITLAKQRFALQLMIVNGIILVLAGTAGYFLAGKTLHPVEVMVDEQKRFVADASHELRTPLTSIKTETEVALRNSKLKTKDLRRLLENNLQEIDKMKYFSDSLLSLSRYEANGHNLILEEVDLKEAIHQAVERNKAQAKEKKIDIGENLSEVIVKGNPQSLVELFSILINNAIKYSKNGKKVRVKVRVRGKNTEISVSDQGIGIRQEDIPHIFDRFYRADSSRNKSKTDGYGLGLAIAKSIVDLHKGEIKVESKLGKGSKFTVILPK